MRVIAHILCKIDDHCYVLDQAADSEAVAELVRGYNAFANRSTESTNPDEHLFVVGSETYGSDFKQWLGLMPAHDKWRLLDRYLSHFPQYAEGDARTERDHHGQPRGREDEADKEERRHRHWVIKFCLIVFLMLFMLLMAAAMAVMSTKHLLPDNAIIKAIFESATELAKILFTIK